MLYTTRFGSSEGLLCCCRRYDDAMTVSKLKKKPQDEGENPSAADTDVDEN